MINLIRLINQNRGCNCHQICSACKRCIHETSRILSSDGDTTEKPETTDPSSTDDMSEPTNCCMSGCVNCVWIQYAEKLSATLEKSDADVQKLILDKVQDPNMKTFLLMELRLRNLIKD
ncbi:oxidoreductase-like domain-containing protein 1 [Ceratina calcarata]|uniref:Oxidoreductase-like domain-containing protein 1 n=1 Tax=Ceratina calcarata TaxID=156304 RepID=A0AAJ7J9I7_9HYME|nr:oxidoreductase-like domain-containing protein 1 [Ceratina calcarata]XP_017888067.1 oxidoreductase-like domain-containing protein 1 [Ceratina calcarata]